MGRVGGLAAALGAGMVIGLSIAASASAEPTDSRAGARSDASESGVRASSGPRRGAGTAESDQGSTRPARVAASADVDIEAPAATLAPIARATRGARIANDEPASTAVPMPAAAAQVSRGAATATAPVAAPPSAAMPAASAPALGSPAPNAAAPTVGIDTPAADVLQTLFGCDPRGRLITIYKGTHFAIPNSFGYFTQKVGGTGTFTAETVYDLKDEDQYDWNKFTGIAFTPLEPDRNSVMVGWRYNLASQEFEIAPFYNVDKKRILPDEQTEVISVPAGETFDYFVDYTGVRISYGGTTVYKPYPDGLKPNLWTAARVSGWFGGNEVAPRTISYYLKFAR